MLAPQGGVQAGSLYGEGVGMCLGIGTERLLRWFAHPLGGVESRGHSQYSAFVPSSSEVVVGFCFFYLVIQNLPHLRMHAVIFSPL